MARPRRSLLKWKLALAIALYSLLFPLRLKTDRRQPSLLPPGFRAGVMCLLRDRFPDIPIRESEDPNAIEMGRQRISLINLLRGIQTARLDVEKAKRKIVHDFEESLQQVCIEPD